MLLTVDVGNTHVKFAVYEGEMLRGNWRATTDRERTPDEWGIHLDRFLALGGLRLELLSGCIIASVVPPLTDALLQMVEKYLNLQPLVVSHESKLGIGIDYPHPYEIGADRLVNAVAASAEYGAPVFVVDF